jgi:hypothetical protein
MRGLSLGKILVTTITIGAVVGGVIWISKAGVRRRQRWIQDFVGFDPTYWQTHQTSISEARAKELADMAYDAVGWLNDNEHMLVSVINQSGDIANLSLVAYYFNIRHKQSMGSFYADYMDRRGETKAIKDALEKITRR